MKKILLIIVIIVIVGIAWKFTKKEIPIPVITTFEECMKYGNAVMESYPRQCRDSGGNLFVENIGNEAEKSDLIKINTPRPNQEITSPVLIRGSARGSWFFEASFPIVITNWDGLIIGEGFAEAKSDWMTVEFVPFEAVVDFTIDKNAYSNRGTLILQKSNPSGLPEHDNTLEIPIVFTKTNENNY